MRERLTTPPNPFAPDAAPRRGLAGALEATVDWFGRLTSWIGLGLVLLVSFDVILRYLFHVGPVSLQELEWHLLSPIALIGMSYAMQQNSHVRVDIFYERFSPRVRRLIDLTAAAITLIISIIIIKLSLGFVQQAYGIGEGSPDPGGLPYRFLLKAFIPFGFALLALQALAIILRDGRALLRGARHG